VPHKGGCIDKLRPFVNVATDDDWRLVVAWLIQALRPRGPYPVLALHGEQGCAKSTTARVLRSLVDPSVALLRCEPRDGRDLMIAADNGWVVAFDNLSHVPDRLSDALCRLATGGGFSTRELFSDREEIIFDAMRPCILTSIEDLASRGDLLERAIILRLPRIEEKGRQTEREFWAAFEAACPRILGALYDAMGVALERVDRVQLDALPRMADFACWATATEEALGWPAGAFLAAYAGNQRDANELALESSPLTGPLRQLAERPEGWEGTATALLTALEGLVGSDVVKRQDWPKRHNALSGQLRRLAPDLRRVGIDVDLGGREPGRKRTRMIRISASEPRAASSSVSSAAAPSFDGTSQASHAPTGASNPGGVLDNVFGRDPVPQDDTDDADDELAGPTDRDDSVRI
jgi:hypothetical protein